MSRRRMVAGNWKMNMTPNGAVKLAERLKPLVNNEDVDVIFGVPAINIVPVAQAVEGTNIKIAAQNMHHEEKGAFTGEISPTMLRDAGVEYVILGHSERRQYFKETSEDINKKVLSAFSYELTPIMCCGETLDQRELGLAKDYIRIQIKIGLRGVTARQAASMVIAYEPIWAIGTGRTATKEQAQEICAEIRSCIAEMYDFETAFKIRILYGGSVNAANTSELFEMPDIDGGLVGGASLKAEFGQIVFA